MKIRLAEALAVLLALTLPGCMITNRDFESLREQVLANQKGLAEIQKRAEEHAGRLEGIDNSLEMLETRTDDNSDRIEDLKARVAAESLPGAGVAMNIPAHPREPGQKQEAPAAGAPGAVAARPQGAGGGTPYTPRLFTRPEDLYNSAYGHFEKGEYGQAILEFEEYVANYPQTELGDNAQYWIGECYYAQKDYRQAVREFEKVEKNFPGGNKEPAAKLKKGMALRELGSREEAAATLEELVSRFPDSEEARLARERLRQWK